MSDFRGYTLADVRRMISGQRKDVRESGFPKATVQGWWIIPSDHGARLSITFATHKHANEVTTRSVSL